MADPQVSFEQEVQSVADQANLPETDVMTPEEEAIQVPAEAEETPKPIAEVVKEPPPEPEKPAAPQVVPLAVHIRQRERYEREQAELRRVVEDGNKRLQQLMETISPPPAPVDRNTDPLGATLQEMDSLRGDIKETKEMLQRRQQEETQRSQINAFQNAVIADEQEFVKQADDYPQAITYVKDMKFREYVALGLDAQQAAARVQQDAFALAQHAFQQGQSPSELAYRMSAALGYKRAAAKAAAAQQEDELATAPVQKTQAEQAVEMRAAGGQRSKGTGGAASTGGAMTFAELANLDNEEFAKMTAGKKWDRLFKGA
jgi:hypothetical protein